MTTLITTLLILVGACLVLAAELRAGRTKEEPMATGEDILVTALVKGREKYVILWTPSHAREVYDTLCRWRDDPELSLTDKDEVRMWTGVQEQLMEWMP